MDPVVVISSDPGGPAVSPLSCCPARYASFGSLRVDLHTGWLFRDGTTITLPAKCLHILQILLSRANEVVAREEIRERVWPVDKDINYAANVNTSVNRLRHELGRDVVYIRTITGVGYCFTGEVAFSDSRLDVPRNRVIEPPLAETRSIIAILSQNRTRVASSVVTIILAGMMVGGSVTTLWLYRFLPRYLTIITSVVVVVLSCAFVIRWEFQTIGEYFWKPHRTDSTAVKMHNA